MSLHAQRLFERFRPTKPLLVGIDSDGCVFDTVELKQKLFFHDAIIRTWGLEALDALVRETASFVFLRSRTRGCNRFFGLYETFRLLRARPESQGVKLPAMSGLGDCIARGIPLDTAHLRREAERLNDPELEKACDWSDAISEAIATRMDMPRPFDGAREAIATLHRDADLVVVTQTPRNLVEREWKANGLERMAALIAGPEAGSKTEQLRVAAAEHYTPENVLMVGDAPGDLEAARAAGAAFFPIEPGSESASWTRLRNEAWPRFIQGAFTDEYARPLTEAFLGGLPLHPPWMIAT